MVEVSRREEEMKAEMEHNVLKETFGDKKNIRKRSVGED